MKKVNVSRREAALAACAAGEAVDAVALRFGVTQSTVKGWCYLAGIPLVTQAGLRRAEKRRRAVELVCGGASLTGAGRKCGMSTQDVAEACRRNGVEVPDPQNNPTLSSPRTFAILAQLINSDESMAVIARQFGVVRERVRQVAAAAQKAGIALHPQRKFPREMTDKNGKE